MIKEYLFFIGLAMLVGSSIYIKFADQPKPLPALGVIVGIVIVLKTMSANNRNS